MDKTNRQRNAVRIKMQQIGAQVSMECEGSVSTWSVAHKLTNKALWHVASVEAHLFTDVMRDLTSASLSQVS